MSSFLKPEDLESKILDFFSDYPEFHSIYLFGSAANGQMHPHSDVDIAISKGKRLDLEVKLTLSSELESLLGTPVDLVDLCGLEGLVLGEILYQGKALKFDLEYYLSKMRGYRHYMDTYYYPHLLPSRKEKVLSYF